MPVHKTDLTPKIVIVGDEDEHTASVLQYLAGKESFVPDELKQGALSIDFELLILQGPNSIFFQQRKIYSILQLLQNRNKWFNQLWRVRKSCEKRLSKILYDESTVAAFFVFDGSAADYKNKIKSWLQTIKIHNPSISIVFVNSAECLNASQVEVEITSLFGKAKQPPHYFCSLKDLKRTHEKVLNEQLKAIPPKKSVDEKKLFSAFIRDARQRGGAKNGEKNTEVEKLLNSSKFGTEIFLRRALHIFLQKNKGTFFQTTLSGMTALEVLNSGEYRTFENLIRESINRPANLPLRYRDLRHFVYLPKKKPDEIINPMFYKNLIGLFSSQKAKSTYEDKKWEQQLENLNNI